MFFCLLVVWLLYRFLPGAFKVIRSAVFVCVHMLDQAFLAVMSELLAAVAVFVCCCIVVLSYGSTVFVGCCIGFLQICVDFGTPGGPVLPREPQGWP